MLNQGPHVCTREEDDGGTGDGAVSVTQKAEQRVLVAHTMLPPVNRESGPF